MWRCTTAERRRRLVARHRLGATPAASVEEVAAGVVGLHATDPASVHLAAAARLAIEPEDAIGAVEAALYDRRTVVRMLGMRRTMFVLPLDLAPVVQAAASAAVADRERRRLEATLAGIGLDGAWLDQVRADVVAALEERREATGADLSKAVPALATRYAYAEGKAYGGEARLTTPVLNGLSAEGRIVRGRPRGTWRSTQYLWSTPAAWFGVPLPTLATEEARTALARRWLAAFGPALVDDVRWWTGWNKGDTARALAGLDLVPVALDGGQEGIALRSDPDEPVAESEPVAALLPALDPTTMGWAGRDWYLDPAMRPALFDGNGNAGPTIWWDGEIVGGWAVGPGGVVRARLLADRGREVVDAVAAAVAKTTVVLGGTTVVPRFRTPLERELSAAPSA